MAKVPIINLMEICCGVAGAQWLRVRLGAVQLILYVIYRGNKGGSKKPTPEETVEMGLPKPYNQEKQSNGNGVQQGHD
jgi:hypothetical protein